ncbi:hypothetical protein [Geotalea toluenoxydans]|uniref:hypothetical protein n=1 Tax=Geotalea toluenoxydans TaxID=421624 RepID=UPI0006D11170|nr:hypothetical protein [Geotalea toluenoxydans]
MQLSEKSQAKACVNKVLKHDADNAEARINLAFLEENNGKRQDVYFSLRRILSISDRDFKKMIKGIEDFHSSET